MPGLSWARRTMLAGLPVLVIASSLFARASGVASPPELSVGYDRNLYPGDAALPMLRRHFAFTGYWLNTPPGARTNTWLGKRETLRRAGFGFLILWNGRLDAEILSERKRHATAPEALGQADAAAAVAAAQHEGFAPGSVLFLDQEEGGRLLPEQASYLLAWTEAVARGGYRPGAYLSGQPVDEGPAPDGKRRTITTAEDVATRVAAAHLHPVALWVAQDTCLPAGPSTGCTVQPPGSPERSGTPDAMVWQYAQSPRRPELTRSCARTYAADGNCVAPELPGVSLDLNVSRSPDPSHGR